MSRRSNNRAASIRRRRLACRGSDANNNNNNAEATQAPAQTHDGRQHFCYALELPGSRRTYVGYTIDPSRRLRQHNGELCGGAAATLRGRMSRGTHAPDAMAWRHMFVVTVEDGATGDDCHRFGSHEGLSLEWHLKHGRGGGGRAPGRRTRPTSAPQPRRIDLLKEALALPKFAAFRDRFVVFAGESCIDAVWAALLDLPFDVCVMDFPESFV